MSTLKKDPDSAGLEGQNGPRYGTIDVKVGTQRDLLDLQDLDPAFNEKMRLVNNVRDQNRPSVAELTFYSRLLMRLDGLLII